MSGSAPLRLTWPQLTLSLCFARSFPGPGVHPRPDREGLQMRLCPGAFGWLYSCLTSADRLALLQETLKEKLERLADPYETNLYVKKWVYAARPA
jgi:hypothetical protein